MSKITPEHLARQACVYVRQSTADQLLHNHESRRRQYGLAERARHLGWSEVIVIDDDLGRSGNGTSRPGFERLLGAICEGRIGIVFAIETSRLARNGRDWHTLLEFCGLVGCLLADEDGVYDVRFPNDRLVLGMKGTMSEMELAVLRQRSLEALRQKARRGELFFSVPVGYVKIRHDRIAMDPDLRVREAITLVFRRFAEFQSIRQVHLWLRQEHIRLPVVEYGTDGPRTIWKLPVYNTVRRLLTNPIYGGAYVFGRTCSRASVRDGRKRIVYGLPRVPEDWEVLIPEHYEGYISWAEFGRNQTLIADNANSKGLLARDSVRRGDSLLAGLMRCGHCGRRLHVSYSGTDDYCVRYNCRGAHLNHGTERCISFGGLRVDAAVTTEALRFLVPLGIEAALRAIEAREGNASEARRQAELALSQARYEADLARRQYDAVDPDYRLVARERERRWNDRLVEVQHLEEHLAALESGQPLAPTAEERARLMALGQARAGRAPAATGHDRRHARRCEVVPLQACRPAPSRMPVPGHDDPGLSHVRNRRRLHQPPSCQPRSKDGFLEAGRRNIRNAALIFSDGRSGWPILYRLVTSWSIWRLVTRLLGLPPCMGLLMSSAFRFSRYIMPIPMFDRRNHPCVPTMMGLGHCGGRRSRMARRATAEGGARRP